MQKQQRDRERERWREEEIRLILNAIMHTYVNFIDICFDADMRMFT